MDKTMNSWTVIVRRGKDLNITLASIYYNKWGTKTQQSVIIVNDWKEGADMALEQGYVSALFVDSGTVFTDWPAWKILIDNYPHKGLIAHIIMHPEMNVRIDSQCWFMDLDIKFDDANTVSYPEPLRSDKDIHDDYTPLWIKPGSKITHHKVDGFGQTLIAQQLNRGKSIVNWTPAARNIKRFMYGKSSLDFFQEYINLAENQFWIFNNEPVNVVDKEKIVCPGSGLFWILNIVSANTRRIDIVDISNVQVKFCREVWQQWDGSDYGSLVVDFINRNDLKHYELDRANLDQIQRLKLKNKSLLKQYVNDRFRYFINQIGLNDGSFQSCWQQCKSSKHVTVQRDNLVDWILKTYVSDKDDYVWTSNILDYKWTLLHSTLEKAEEFRSKLR